MNWICWRLVATLSHLLTPDEREAIRGDLEESGATGSGAMRDLLGLVIRRQAPVLGPTLLFAVQLVWMMIRIASESAVYGWMYLSNWTAGYLAPGFRDDLVHSAFAFLLSSIVLACWAWTTGLLLGSLSERSISITRASFFAIAITLTVLSLMVGNSAPGHELSSLAAYRILTPVTSLICLILVPFSRGIRQASRIFAFPVLLRNFAWLFAVVTMLQFGAVTLRPRWQIQSALLAFAGPLAYSVAKTGRRRRVLVSVSALCFVLSVEPLAADAATDSVTPKAQRAIAPDFRLTDAKGQSISLSAYKGKVVLLDFWATWCGGCKTEIPWYIEFEKTYRDQGLAVIGVSMDDEGMKIVKPFLLQRNIQYPVVIGSDQLAQKYKLTTMPLTLLIDRDGRIAVAHTGVVDKSNFESHIKELLR